MYAMVGKTHIITLGVSKNKIIWIIGTSFAPKHKINLIFYYRKET